MMRAALIVIPITGDKSRNLAAVLRLAGQAVTAGAELLLLPEAALTGLVTTDYPGHDLPLGDTIPGPTTEALATFCRARSVWLGIGLLERVGTRLYDSAVLINAAGNIALTYRRIQPGWHGSRAEPTVYCHGTDVPVARTPFGKVAFLICGDLFDDRVLGLFRQARPDLLLFPFARSFTAGSYDQTRWDREELPAYSEQVRRLKTPALMVNALSRPNGHGEAFFGGAWALSAEGEVLAARRLGAPGMLLVDLNMPAAEKGR